MTNHGLSAANLFGRFLDMSGLGRLVCVAVTACNRPNPASDVFVCFVGQIRQGDAQRPVGGLEAAAIEQHDSVILGQSECEIERVYMLLQIFYRFVADVLARPELEVDEAI